MARPTKIILVTAFCCFLIMLPTFLALELTFGYSITLGYTVAFSAFSLAGAWAVFGTQDYLVRTLIGLSTVLGASIGMILSNVLTNAFTRTSILDFDAWIILLCAFNMAILSQIPFFLLFWLAGWHFANQNEPSRASLSIRNMFSIVFVFSLALTSLQIASQRVVVLATNQVQIGNQIELIDNDTLQNSGLTSQFSTETVTVSEENFEQSRSRAIDESGYREVYAVAFYAFAFSLLSIPLIWFAFRMSTLRGCIYTVLTGVGLCAILTGILALTGGPNTTRLPILTGCVLSLLFSWIPLRMIRRSGIELRTRWQKSPAVTS